MNISGIDGCKGGWVVAQSLSGGERRSEVSFSVVTHLGGLFGAAQSGEVVWLGLFFACKTDNLSTMERMNISKEDAIAHLAKWHDAGTKVRAIYTTITGNLSMVGKIVELSPAAIKIMGSECETLLYFGTTSKYDYKDPREIPTEANKARVNKYPTIIEIKFGTGDRVEIVESFSE